jgi:hypothetical protein
MLIHNLFTLLHVAYVDWGNGTGGRGKWEGGGLDEALNKSSQQPVMMTRRGPCTQTNGIVITRIICNKLQMSQVQYLYKN